jgi:hypothetical protein
VEEYVRKELTYRGAIHYEWKDMYKGNSLMGERIVVTIEETRTREQGAVTVRGGYTHGGASSRHYKRETYSRLFCTEDKRGEYSDRGAVSCYYREDKRILFRGSL